MSAAQLIRETFRPSMTVGKVYARVYGSAAPMMEVGNVLELNLEHSENVLKQDDMTQLGGGIYAEVRRVSDVQMSMKMADLNVTNFSRAVLGSVTGVDAGHAANEEHRAYKGGLIRLAHVGASNVVLTKASQSTTHVSDEAHPNVTRGSAIATAHAGPINVSVKVNGTGGAAISAAGNYTVTGTGIVIDANASDIADTDDIYISYDYPAPVGLDEATNFDVRPEGIYVLPDAADIDDKDDVYISYDYGDQAVIEALTQKTVELELSFGGLNEAKEGRPCVVDVYRVSQSITKQLALINSAFGELDVEGSVMMDPNKIGTGISKYYKATLA